MLILNYHFDRLFYFDAREDRIRCNANILAEFEGERINLEGEFYSIGRQIKWGPGNIFFNKGKQPSDYVSRLLQELNGEHTIANYITSNHTFVLGTYTNVPKIHINELDILRRKGINSDKIHWRIKFFLPAAHKYVTVWIKQGHPYIKFKKEMNWDSGIWYPG